jgi:cobalt-zinc-cadmium efflux system outer membrane protein
VKWILYAMLIGGLMLPAEAQPPIEEPEIVPEIRVPEEVPPPPPPPDPWVLQPDAQQGLLRLSATQAVAQAWQSNPEIQAADARVRQAYWAYQASDSLPSASLGVGTWQGGGQALLNGNYIGEIRSDYYVWLTQPFRPLGSLETSRRQAYRGLTQAQSGATLARIQLAQRVKDAYYQLMAAEQQLLVAQQNLELAEQILQVTQLRFQKGAGPRLDEINATIQRNRSRQDLTLVKGQLGQARARLAPLLGLGGQSPLQTEGALAPPTGRYLYETLIGLARQHPRLQMAQEAVKQSSLARRLAEQQGNPQPNLYAAYDLVRPSYVVQLTLSIPLDWGAIRNDVREKRESEKEKEQTLYGEQLALSAELRSAFESYEAAFDNASSYQEDVLKPSEESTRITEYGYRRGAIPFLQLLTSEQQLSSIRKDYIERQLAVHLALNALEALVGRQLEGVTLE